MTTQTQGERDGAVITIALIAGPFAVAAALAYFVGRALFDPRRTPRR